MNATKTNWSSAAPERQSPRDETQTNVIMKTRCIHLNKQKRNQEFRSKQEDLRSWKIGGSFTVFESAFTFMLFEVGTSYSLNPKR